MAGMSALGQPAPPRPLRRDREGAVLGGVRDPLDLEVHPALPDQVVPVRRLGVVEDLVQGAGDVPADHELGVDQQQHLEAVLGDRHNPLPHARARSLACPPDFSCRL